MRRIVLLALTLVLILAMSMSVSAVTAATSVNSVATVSTDESCNVTMSVTIHLDAPVDKLTFPLPVHAGSITVNGSRVGVSQTSEARWIDLSGMTGDMAGDFTFTVSYRLEDVVRKNDAGFLELQIPLLSGFAYPVQKLDFTVTLPGEVEAKPAFSSGYHQSNIEQDLSFSVEGATITGSSLKDLKDRETLDMTVSVSEEMFPQKVLQLQDFSLIYVLLGISAGLALVYWLIFLRNAPPRLLTTPTPPDGYTAGQLGSVISLQGTDLTMMVFTWAQLGYLLISLDRKNRVVLHKQMEMGNERSGFEQRCYRELFGKRASVDTSGYHYAVLSRKVDKNAPDIHGLAHPKSGSLPLFRALACLPGLFGGMILGMVLGAEAALQWLIIILLAAFGGISCWLIHPWAAGTFLRKKGKLWLSLAMCLCWIIFSASAGMVSLGVWMLLGQLLAGLLAFFGGRRTEAGRQLMSEALGLRRYLRSISRTQLQHICQQNPEYFFSLAPYALALDTDRAFANRFGKTRLPPCPYVTTGTEASLTAAEWCRLMRRIASAMDERRNQLVWEKLLGLIQGLRGK